MGRPKSGASAPKNRRLSLVDRMSLMTSGKLYETPTTPSLPERIEAALNQTPTGKTISASPQMAKKAAPVKTTTKRTAKKAVATPKAAPAKKVAPTKSNRPVPQITKEKPKSPYGNIEANIKAQAKKTGTTGLINKVNLTNPDKEVKD